MVFDIKNEPHDFEDLEEIGEYVYKKVLLGLALFMFILILIGIFISFN